MLTSDRNGTAGRTALRVRAAEALALAAVFALLPAALHARLGRTFEPHPGWIAVVILGARYGNPGMLAGLALVAAAVALGSAISGDPAAAWNGIGSGADLVAFGACLGITWVAASHLRREAELRERLDGLTRRAEAAEATTESLRELVERLRRRLDRPAASLGYLRDALVRLGGRDPVSAAEGAADLALVRSGASIVSVGVGEGETLRRLVVREAAGADDFGPLLPGDADLLVPIDAGGERVGAIAFLGLPPGAVDQATQHDLEAIASWCAPAIAAVRGPRRTVAPAAGAP
jgi:hypothetical protein